MSFDKVGGNCEHCGDRVPGTPRYSLTECCAECREILDAQPKLTAWIEKVVASKVEDVLSAHTYRYKHEREDNS